MPDIVASHFDGRGSPNDYTSRLAFEGQSRKGGPPRQHDHALGARRLFPLHYHLARAIPDEVQEAEKSLSVQASSLWTRNENLDKRSTSRFRRKTTKDARAAEKEAACRHRNISFKRDARRFNSPSEQDVRALRTNFGRV